ncbi:MAG TPA: SPFH domain-containing protein [Candidatus Nanopelagicales bacterium]
METWQSLVIAGVLVLIGILIVFSTIKIVPQAQAGIVERLGRFNRTLDAGLAIIIPFVDRLRPLIDLREQVVSFPPQPVITSDNLVVNIDSVIYFQVTDPKAATYEIQSYLQGIEQLTVTTLRNVIGSMDLEETLTSRDSINGQLRGVLDEATGKWGIRVNRVELKAIDPPASVQQSMEKQMRADRDKRAAILSAEGSKQAAILEAEGSKTAAVLKAEGQARAQVLRAEGEAEAIAKVFNAINSGHATDQVMAYQYLQSLPLLAQGTANKVFVIPAELSGALGAVTRAFQPGAGSGGPGSPGAAWATSAADADIVDAEVVEPTDPAEAPGPSLAEQAVAEAEAEAAEAQAAAERAAYGHAPPGHEAGGAPAAGTGATTGTAQG